MSTEYQPVAINSRIETEEVLGPLPENWEKAPFGETNRYFFVDHNTKSTTWIDPRTYHLRKHDIREIVAGELPYGWEEAFDQKCGIYYIDHITQHHFLDAPWEEHVRDEVLVIHEQLNSEASKLDEQVELEKQKRMELENLEAKIADLEAERMRLEREIEDVQAQMNDDPDNDDLAQQEIQLQDELAMILQQLEQERMEHEQLAADHAALKKDIEEYELRLHELRAVNDRLENENKDLMDENKAANEEIVELRNMIEMEAAQRSALEAYIKQLKNEVLHMYDPDQAEQIAAREAEEIEMAEEIEVDAPLPETGVMNPDEEVKMLQERLDEERSERERLKELTETLEAERNRIQEEESGQLPEWVVELNVNAEKSKTFRMKIAKAAAENPDGLEFRDKVAFFTSAAIEAHEEPKSPEEELDHPDFAMKPRETAYGSVEEIDDEYREESYGDDQGDESREYE